MENEREDWFSDGWTEDGGVVADGREEEAMPEDTEAAETAGAQAETGTQGEFDADVSDDLIRFVREYPDVRAEDIPRSVWDRVVRGESLVAAWGKYEAEALREENRRLREKNDRREQNRQRSAGSQRGIGASGSAGDAFDRGWEGAW